MKVLYINSVCGFGSTGRIVSSLASNSNYESLVCYGRKKDYSNINSYKFASIADNCLAAFNTIIFDNNLNGANRATNRLIKKIKEYNPDIIHLHNLHGYYLSVEVLLKFLKEYNKPIVYTMHDVWPITGLCCDIVSNPCDQYKKGCKACKYPFLYPFSLFKQNVSKEYLIKKKLFNELNNLTLVSPSIWLKDIVKESYLKDKRIEVINNGIALDAFKSNKEKEKKFTILAVSSVWDKSKGVDDLNKIKELLPEDIEMKVIGKNSNLVKRAKTIDRTSNIKELADLYSSSHLLINPTNDDNFPTVNIEALACGTPVITYDTGGSKEIIDNRTGIVIKKGDYKMMAKTISELKDNYYFKKEDCLTRAELFSNELMNERYRKLYESLMVK